MGITFNEELYHSWLQTGFSWLLESDFLNTDVYNMSDDEVMAFIEHRTRVLKEEGMSPGRLEPFKDFCTLVINKGHADCQYAGRDYTVAKIGFAHEDRYISYRLFNTSCMQPKVSDNDKNFIQDCAAVYCRNYIFNNSSSIEKLFEEPSDIPLLYLYSFDAQDDYFKSRRCYKFLLLDSNVTNNIDILREKIVQSQLFALRHLLKYPTFHALPYRGILWGEPRVSFANYLNSNYFSEIKEKYDFIKNIMYAHNIRELDSF